MHNAEVIFLDAAVQRLADRRLGERGWVINVGVPREPPAPWNDARQLPKLRSSALDSPHVFVAQEAIFISTTNMDDPDRHLTSPHPSQQVIHQFYGGPNLSGAAPVQHGASSALQRQHKAGRARPVNCWEPYQHFSHNHAGARAHPR